MRNTYAPNAVAKGSFENHKIKQCSRIFVWRFITSYSSITRSGMAPVDDRSHGFT